MTVRIITDRRAVPKLRNMTKRGGSERASWLARHQPAVCDRIIKEALAELPDQVPELSSPRDRSQFYESIAFGTIQKLRSNELEIGITLEASSSSQWQYTLERTIGEISDLVVAEYLA